MPCKTNITREEDEEEKVSYAAESDVQEVFVIDAQLLLLPSAEGATNLPSMILSHPVFEDPLRETTLVESGGTA